MRNFVLYFDNIGEYVEILFVIFLKTKFSYKGIEFIL